MSDQHNTWTSYGECTDSELGKWVKSIPNPTSHMGIGHPQNLFIYPTDEASDSVSSTSESETYLSFSDQGKGSTSNSNSCTLCNDHANCIDSDDDEVESSTESDTSLSDTGENIIRILVG